ncbi:hypothetical protein [Hymenobacter latericus]|nr:hypothetical protein [Hymenobacter sp. YIM 151858-1]UYZ57906.1 hypothetical protein OIS50_12655 [Hymenobacter sp. YIM 151858-1]
MNTQPALRSTSQPSRRTLPALRAMGGAPVRVSQGVLRTPALCGR